MIRILLVVASFAILTAGEPEPQYQNSIGSYGAPPPQQYSPSTPEYGAPHGGGVHRHVFVHVAAPEPPEPRRARPYIPPPAPEKHYKIIFIKAPTDAPPEQQEVELPPHPEQKTLVYVLLRKPEPAPDVKINSPGPAKITKPEVYFIRYKNKEQQQGYGPPVGGAPAPPQSPPPGLYGAP